MTATMVMPRIESPAHATPRPQSLGESWRLLEPLCYLPPAEFQELHHRAQVAQTKSLAVN